MHAVSSLFDHRDPGCFVYWFCLSCCKFSVLRSLYSSLKLASIVSYDTIIIHTYIARYHKIDTSKKVVLVVVVVVAALPTNKDNDSRIRRHSHHVCSTHHGRMAGPLT